MLTELRTRPGMNLTFLNQSVPVADFKPNVLIGLPWWLNGKESACNAGDKRDTGLIPGWGRCPGQGNGNPLQYSCLENPMDGGAWQAVVPGVARVGHDLATKPPPLLCRHYTLIKLSLWNNSSRPNKHFNFFFFLTQFEAFRILVLQRFLDTASKVPGNFLQILKRYKLSSLVHYSDFVLKLILAYLFPLTFSYCSLHLAIFSPSF